MGGAWREPRLSSAPRDAGYTGNARDCGSDAHGPARAPLGGREGRMSGGTSRQVSLEADPQ